MSDRGRADAAVPAAVRSLLSAIAVRGVSLCALLLPQLGAPASADSIDEYVYRFGDRPWEAVVYVPSAEVDEPDVDAYGFSPENRSVTRVRYVTRLRRTREMETSILPAVSSTMLEGASADNLIAGATPDGQQISVTRKGSRDVISFDRDPCSGNLVSGRVISLPNPEAAWHLVEQLHDSQRSAVARRRTPHACATPRP